MLLILWLLALMINLGISPSSARGSPGLRCLHFDKSPRNQSNVPLRFLDNHGCGFRPYYDRPQTARISGGYEARDGEFPSFVGILKENNDGGRSLCSGTIISEWIVLSAAHCFGAEANRAWVAASYKNPLDWTSRDNKIQVHTACLANNYNSGFNSDYAIVVLQKPFVFNEFIQPACLATQPAKLKQKALITGIGLLRDIDYIEQTTRLNALPVKRVPDDYCSDRLEEIATLSCYMSYKEPYIGSICRGDSGGPVYAKYQNRQYVIGINIAGLSVCEAGKNAQSLHTDVGKVYNALLDLLDQCFGQIEGK